MWGEIADVLSVLGSFDEPFVAWRHDGPPAGTAAALGRFPVALPTAWDDLAALLVDDPPSDVDWGSVLAQAGDLAAQDALGGAAAALYALAGWQAGRRVTAPLDDGWYAVPPRVAELLLAAGGYRGGGTLVSASRQHIERVEREYYRPDFTARMAPYRQATDRLATAWRDAMEELAYGLRTACRRGTHRLRAVIAALFWVAGDAPRAELIAADSSYTPTLDVFTDLTSTAVPSLAHDLLAQHTWLALKDWPELDLRRHGILFPLINARYDDTPLYERDNLAAAVGDSGPGKIFAGGLIEYFDRSVTDQVRRVVGDTFDGIPADVWESAPAARLRYQALRLLLDGTGDWWELAADATTLLDSAARGNRHLAAAQWLDVPLSYVDGNEERAVAALERHRAAALAYRFAVAAPPPPPDDRLADALADEGRLLDELRATWFIRLIPALPDHYQHFTVDLATIPGSGVEPGDPEVFADYDAFPDLTTGPHPFDQDDAAKRADRAWADLAALWERAAAVAPGYATVRADPATDLDAFTAALTTAPAHRTRPIGPAPVRRSSARAEYHPSSPAAADPYTPAEQPGRRAEELTERFKRTGDLDDLAAAIRADEEACRLVPQGTSQHLHYLDHQSMLRAVRYLHNDDESDLATAIAGHEAAVMQSKRPGVPPDLCVALRYNAGMDYMHRYRRRGDLADLDRALEHWRAATRIADGSSDRGVGLRATYVDGLRQRYDRDDDLNTLRRLVDAIHELADLTGEPTHLAAYSDALLAVHVRTGEPDPVDTALDAIQAAIARTSATSGRYLPDLLARQAAGYLARHTLTVSADDLEAAIAALTEAVATAPLGSPQRHQWEEDLGRARARRTSTADGDPTSIRVQS